MNRSESIIELCKAMANAFGEIENAVKDKTNPHFRSKYADLGNVVDAIKPALTKNGLFFCQHSHDKESHVCVETIIYHQSGEFMSCGFVSVPVSKHDAQGFGSAMTYARRYSLSAAFGVAPEDDDGNAASKAAPAPKSKSEKDQYIKSIAESEDENELRETYTKAVQAMRGDRLAIVEIAAAKDKRKAELQGKNDGSITATDSVPGADVLA